MRILVHDYAGHPFQVQLSRELAHRGHAVLHCYNSALVGPRGELSRRGGDPPNLSVVPISLGRGIRRSHYVERWVLERRYGSLLVDTVRATNPDVVLSGNTPLDAQGALLSYCRRAGIGFAYWAQDLIGDAMTHILGARVGAVGRAVAATYKLRERRLLRRSEAVVAIAEDFLPYLRGAGVLGNRVSIIPNWAPVSDLPQLGKDNRWAREHGLSEKFVFLYSGTLGFKHDPGILLRLAAEFGNTTEITVIVVSEGEGADWLAREATGRGISNLTVLPFQPFGRMPEVMASADVLVAVLEASAGLFSVPSKVLTYHCSGRPILLSVPEKNLVARIVVEHGSGLVSRPDDDRGFRDNGWLLYRDAALRERMGRAARAYAEETFALGPIATRFEGVLSEIVGRA